MFSYHLNLGDRFDKEKDLVLLVDPDDPSECYQAMTRLVQALIKSYDRRDILADYTGGTKTMSMALGMAAMDYDLQLYLTTSTLRTNLIGVDAGQSTELISTALINVERKLEQFLPTYLEQFQYAAAASQLQNLLVSIQIPQEGKKVWDSLTIRNRSLLAHGFTPITHLRFGTIHEKAVGFIRKGIEIAASTTTDTLLRQFPTSLKL